MAMTSVFSQSTTGDNEQIKVATEFRSKAENKNRRNKNLYPKIFRIFPYSYLK